MKTVKWAIDWVVINVFTKKKNREERMCLSLANISYRKIKRMK